MTEFLQRIKETERIIRQEDEFIGKVRMFKPKIQLVNSDMVEEETMMQKRIKRRRKNSPPVSALRTGIILPPSIFY